MGAASTIILIIALTAPVDATSTPESVVQAMFHAFNRHDADAMAKLYASDARLMSSDFCRPRVGRAEVVRTYRELFAAFPGISDEVEHMVVQGDQVAVRFVAKGEAGNAPLNQPIATFFTVRQGLIHSDESMFDAGGRPCSP
jgi:ketosteroid isomerase-like protein